MVRPSKMIIKEISIDDIVQIELMQPQGWNNVGPMFRHYVEVDYCFPIKVENENQIVGIGNAIFLKKTGWLSHIIVKPEHQRKGIGTKIVKYLKDLLIEKGTETISLIATEQGYPVYKKLGFVEEIEYVCFSKGNLIADKSNLNSFQRIITDEIIEKILVFDKEISGEDRSEFIKKYSYNGFVYLENGKVEGFYLSNCGEGPIFSKKEEIGLKLIQLRSSISEMQFSFPITNKTAIEFLNKNRYTHTKNVMRMKKWGNNISWKSENVFCRIGGYLG